MLESLDHLVVQDIFFTKTAELADVVLPAAAAWCETEGTVTNSERRVQRVRKALEPPEGARPDLDILLDVGTAAIGERNRELSGACIDRLAEIGWPSVTPRADDRRGATVAIPSRDAPGLCKALMERDIVTSHRDDNVRASFHFYNNGDDIEALIAALVDLRPRFAPASA